MKKLWIVSRMLFMAISVVLLLILFPLGFLFPELFIQIHFTINTELDDILKDIENLEK